MASKYENLTFYVFNITLQFPDLLATIFSSQCQYAVRQSGNENKESHQSGDIVLM